MIFTMFQVFLEYDKQLDKRFVRALKDQGHSVADIFSILLDMEFQNRPRWTPKISQAIREGTVNGYLCFERGECGHWHVLLSDSGRNHVLGGDES